jgi:predicted Zn-dependent protease
MADIARETGRSDLEIENLTIILGLDRSNVPLLKRLVSLLIEAGQKEKARSTLRQLIRAAPSDPAIDSFNQQLAGMEP